MISCGSVVFANPLKKSVKVPSQDSATTASSEDSLTGDNRFVTENICEKLDISTADMLEGQEIDEMDDVKIQSVVQHSDVFVSLTLENKKTHHIHLQDQQEHRRHAQ